MEDLTNNWIEQQINTVIKRHRKRQKHKQHKDNGQLLADVLPYLRQDDSYYIKRGVPKKIIERYHISFCDNPKKPFFNRVFIPVLDLTGTRVIGYTGRSIHEKCDKCGLYHDSMMIHCPDMEMAPKYAKWKHSYGFKTEQHLYNLWHAKRSIHETGTAIIVEGPADVWAYEAADIHNSVAIFGISISQHQRRLLQKMGAFTLIITLDNDQAGQAAKAKIVEELGHYFRLFFIVPNGQDIGAMNSEEINEQIRPVLEEASRVILSDDKYID